MTPRARSSRKKRARMRMRRTWKSLTDGFRAGFGKVVCVPARNAIKKLWRKELRPPFVAHRVSRTRDLGTRPRASWTGPREAEAEGLGVGGPRQFIRGELAVVQRG